MPNANAPNAPCVLVWLSPQTMVMPGCVNPKLRANHVHDALLGRIHIEQRHAEISTILLQSLNLAGRNWIRDRSAARLGRNIVIDRGDCALRLPDPAACHAQSLEGLRRSDLVHQMQIDVKQRQLSGGNTDDVLIPDFVEQCELLSHGFPG